MTRAEAERLVDRMMAAREAMDYALARQTVVQAMVTEAAALAPESGGPGDAKKRPTTEDEWWEAGHCPMYPGDGPRCETLEQTSECEDDCNCTSRLVTDLGLPSTSQVTMPGPQPAVVSGSEITGVAAPGARHGQEPSSPSSAQGEGERSTVPCCEHGYPLAYWCQKCRPPSLAGGGA